MRDRGFPVPEAWLNQPELDDEWQEFLDAFWILSTSRSCGFGIGYVPLTEIEAFCRMFPVVDVPFFVQVIRHLDRLFVDFHSEKSKAESKGKK